MNLQVSLDALGTAIFVFKKSGEIVYANFAAENLVAIDLEALRNKNIREIIPLELSSVTSGYITERKLTLGESESRWLRLSFDTCTADDDVCWVATATDVTPSRILYRLEQEQRSLRQYSDELEALYRATSVLFTSDNPTRMARQIADAVVRDFSQADCGVMIVDQTTGQIVRLARAGDYKVQANTLLDLTSPGLVPEAARTGNILYVPDISQDKRYVANEPRTRSELVLPLKTPRGLIGVLDLQSANVYAFSETDQRVLKAFAERAALAMENILLNEQILSYAETLETRVLERTAELNDAVHRVEAILNSANDTILLIRLDQTIKRANPAFTRMFGYSLEESTSISILDLFEQKTQTEIETAFTNVLRSGDPEVIQMEAIRRDGSIFDAEVALSSINADQMQGIVCNIHDMTEHKQIELALMDTLARERELNTLKTEFVTLVSHEFRTPLTTILSSAAMLEKYQDRLEADRRLHHLQKIQQQVHYLVNVMEDILHIGRVESEGLEFHPERVNLQGFCAAVSLELQSAHHATPHIVFDIQPELQHIITDTKLLRLILHNLLSNAIKYSPLESEIIIRFSGSENHITLHVRDHGIGISEQDRMNLFKTFFRGKNVGNIPGTGLGLVIVKQAVDALSGQIHVESEIGAGTTFTVVLPHLVASKA